MKKIVYLSIILTYLIFSACSSPLTRLLTTGDPSIPQDEIMESGYYFVSQYYYGIFGPVKYYEQKTNGFIQSEFILSVNSQLNLNLPKNMVMVNGPYSNKESADRHKKEKIENIIWHGSGNYREIYY